MLIYMHIYIIFILHSGVRSVQEVKLCNREFHMPCPISIHTLHIALTRGQNGVQGEVANEDGESIIAQLGMPNSMG